MCVSGLEEILRGLVDGMYVDSKGEVVLVIGLGRVVNMYLRGGNLSISLRRPEGLLVIAGGRVVRHGVGGDRDERLGVTVDGVIIDNGKLYLVLKAVAQSN